MKSRKDYRLSFRSSCSTTFLTLYGIGKVKASRLSCFHLTHPLQVIFRQTLPDIMYSNICSNLFAFTPLNNAIRSEVYLRMEKKINSYCYQSYRLFQNLPTRGQRTRTNGNTSRRRDPYQMLQINLKFFKGAAIAYKRLELVNNRRYEELKAFDLSVQESLKKKKKSKK